MQTPEHRLDVVHAVSFLRLVYPTGPWLLTACEPDRKGIETRTFLPDQLVPLRDWLGAQHARRWNLYWSVNPPRQPLDKKAAKEDIAALHFLHIDIDPRVGEDLTAERERILALLTTNLPAGMQPPTLVIDSGGGFAGYWKLTEPLVLPAGETATVEDAERYNKQLEVTFGGDHCFDVCRIMRLPGSVNYPGEKKAKKGRVVAMAKLGPHDIDRVYALSQFRQAPPKNAPAAASSVQVNVANARRLASVDELDQWGVPDRVKIIIVQGSDPDNPKPKDNSRSAWVMDACCQLARAGVPDEVIFSILTDPGLRISDSILDKGTNAERYALRQIARAKAEAVEPWLMKLNERHFVVRNWGGKCRVVEVVHDKHRDRSYLSKQSFDDFRNAYMNIRVEAGQRADGAPALMPLGKFWLEHSARRQFDTMTFAPGQATEDGVYNLWRGFRFEPRPGDWSLLRAHLHDNICAGTQEHFDYLIRWMARAVQSPAEPGGTAVVLRGDPGVGKSFAVKKFGHLFGPHFFQVTNPSHLVGNFNSHLRDCVLLFGDEAFYAGDKKHESILKMLITEDLLTIEAKGVDVEQSPNFTHLMLASNSRWVVPAGMKDRRFFVLDVAAHHARDRAYFDAIAAQLEAGGYAALLHDLLSMDLAGWDAGRIPDSAARMDQILHSLRGTERIVYDLLMSGEAPMCLFDKERRDVFIPTEPLCDGDRKLQTGIGRELAKAAGEGATGTREIVEGRERRGCWLPPLGAARHNWADAHGLPVRWPRDDSQWVGAGELPL